MVKNDTQLHRAAKGLKIKKVIRRYRAHTAGRTGAIFLFCRKRADVRPVFCCIGRKTGRFQEIPLSDEFRTGKVFSVWIEGLGDGAVFIITDAVKGQSQIPGRRR